MRRKMPNDHRTSLLTNSKAALTIRQQLDGRKARGIVHESRSMKSSEAQVRIQYTTPALSKATVSLQRATAASATSNPL